MLHLGEDHTSINSSNLFRSQLYVYTKITSQLDCLSYCQHHLYSIEKANQVSVKIQIDDQMLLLTIHYTVFYKL